MDDASVAAQLRALVHQPNPTDPTRWDVAPGKHRAFSELCAALPSPDTAGLGSMGEAVGALADIAAERRRQIDVEGWAVEHDDAHTRGEMATAAGIYALCAGSNDYRWVARGLPVNDYLTAALKLWPWDSGWFKPKDRRRDLIRAAALLVAEIERLDRASPPIGDHNG